MFFAGRFTLSQSSPPVRNATYLLTFYFRIYSRDFVNQHVFLLLDLHWDNPKLPWGMQRICGPFVLKTIITSSSCDTRTLDLCILFKFIFLYLWYFPPHYCAFRTFYFTPIFSSHVYITTRNIFLIPNDAVAQNLIINYNFSSQRLHLNYLFLSNAYSFDTIEFSMKNKY